jgi:nucleotidyltransferase substrate binding protein (TIGR01987 family)
MSEAKLRQSVGNLGRVLDRLEEAPAVPLDQPLAIDGTIQRFEFALELFWKTLKRLLETKGRQVSLPRDVLKYAYAEGWLDDEARWLQMLRDRNETSHIYDEETARRIYGHIKDNFPEMRKAQRAILDQLNG